MLGFVCVLEVESCGMWWWIDNDIERVVMMKFGWGRWVVWGGGVGCGCDVWCL